MEPLKGSGSSFMDDALFRPRLFWGLWSHSPFFSQLFFFFYISSLPEVRGFSQIIEDILMLCL